MIPAKLKNNEKVSSVKKIIFSCLSLACMVMSLSESFASTQSDWGTWGSLANKKSASPSNLAIAPFGLQELTAVPNQLVQVPGTNNLVMQASTEEIKATVLSPVFSFVWNHTGLTASALTLAGSEIASRLFNFTLRELPQTRGYMPGMREVLWWQSQILGRAGSMVGSLGLLGFSYYELHQGVKKNWGTKGVDILNIGLGTAGVLATHTARNYSNSLYIGLAQAGLDPSGLILSSVVLAMGVTGFLMHNTAGDVIGFAKQNVKNGKEQLKIYFAQPNTQS